MGSVDWTAKSKRTPFSLSVMLHTFWKLRCNKTIEGNHAHINLAVGAEVEIDRKRDRYRQAGRHTNRHIDKQKNRLTDK